MAKFDDKTGERLDPEPEPKAKPEPKPEPKLEKPQKGGK